MFLLGGGGLYLALFLVGVAGSGEWLPANRADDVLHLALGVAMVVTGVVTTRESAPGPREAS
jgi:hypothetical protein